MSNSSNLDGDNIKLQQEIQLNYNSLTLVTYGYIRDCFKTFAISQIMPLSLYEIIYKYVKSNTLSIAMLGHVDCGKSTMLGRLLYDTGAISNEELNEIRHIARDLGKESFTFAFICDKIKQERERGISITGSTHSFQTESNNFFIHDIPGHRDFIKNASKYIALADVAILVVSAALGEFETNISNLPGHRLWGSVTGMARIHVQKCMNVGVKQLIVCINKMDARSVNYAEERYVECRTELTGILKQIGYTMSNILFIPTCGWLGANIRGKASLMPWYKGFEIGARDSSRGYTLYDALEHFVEFPVLTAAQSKQISGSGIVSIFKRFQFCNNFFLGKVERGSVRIGEKVLFHPKSGATGIVQTIGMNNDNNRMYAQYGDCVGIKIEGLTKDFHKNDIMLCIPDGFNGRSDILYGQISKQIRSFNVTVSVLKHPNSLYCKGGRCNFYHPLVYVGTRRACCKMIQIKWKISGNVSTQKKEMYPSFCDAGDKANIELLPNGNEPLTVTTRQQFERYAKIVVHNQADIVMCGYVTHVQY